MLIEKGKWNRRHVLYGIEKVCKNPYFIEHARELDAIEFGAYFGDCTQLIDNAFYAHQFPIRKIFGLDSFEGLPNEAIGVERFGIFSQGIFANPGQKTYPLRPNGQYIKCWFNELTTEHIQKYDMKPFAFVHIDGDLYISALDALHFLFSNNLIIEGTVIAFDEFKSTNTLDSGGESLAWKETCDKFLIETEEFYRNTYIEGIELWQNAFEIKSIGQKNEIRLLNV